MDEFFLSPFSLSVLNVAIILLFMVFYMFRLKQKSVSTKLLLFFISGVTGVFLSFAFIFSSLNYFHTTVAWWVLHLIVFGAVAMVQFAYHFPKHTYPRESKVAIYICIAASVLIYPVYIYNTYNTIPSFNPCLLYTSPSPRDTR